MAKNGNSKIIKCEHDNFMHYYLSDSIEDNNGYHKNGSGKHEDYCQDCILRKIR